MLIRRAEIPGTGVRDVRAEGETIVAVAPGLEPLPRESVLDAGGAALLPGLHDHHLHLLALAAALSSVRCGPPHVSSAADLERALRGAAQSRADAEWLRGTGYHESVAGPLERARLDALCPGRPLRVQHRSGALWMLNTAGLARIGLRGRLGPEIPTGVERGARGEATGRIYRLDVWLGRRWGTGAPPDLAEVGALLARAGVTGVTDATPANAAAELETLAGAFATGALPQRIRLMGSAGLPESPRPGVVRGELKIVLTETALPELDAFTARVSAAHQQGRGVAVHCVTRAELTFAAVGIEAAGPGPADRIEHAAIAPPDLAQWLARLGLCVVTQPNFVHERGDAYRSEVDASDLPWLYRCQGLLDAGVSLAGGTDAPFGEPDPWLAMRAATDRATRGGARLGDAEALAPERALALFTTRADAPGGPPRTIAPGEPAALCLLDCSWSKARKDLTRSHVRATLVSGDVVFDAAR